MKKLLPVLCLLIAACGRPSVKFTPKLDSADVVYLDSVQGPFKFTGIYQTVAFFHPKGDSGVTTSGYWIVDTLWAVKQQTDTNKTEPHSYKYQQVNKRYVSLAPKYSKAPK